MVFLCTICSISYKRKTSVKKNCLSNKKINLCVYQAPFSMETELKQQSSLSEYQMPILPTVYLPEPWSMLLVFCSVQQSSFISIIEGAILHIIACSNLIPATQLLGFNSVEGPPSSSGGLIRQKPAQTLEGTLLTHI